MQAWRSITPGISGLELKSLPRPEPGAGEVLIAVEAAALNFSDILMIEDKYQVRPDRPYTPGQEVAGTVVAVGPDCLLQVGDRVASELVIGGFADHALVVESMAMKVPDSLAIEQAAALPVVYTTAMVALTRSTKLAANETVLIHAAAGGVGLAAVEIARSIGATVIAAASSDDKRTIALQHGADDVIDYTDSDWPKKIKAMTNGKGVDVVLDPVGGEITAGSLKCLALNGRLLVVGFAGGEIHHIPANRLLLKQLSAIGVYYKHDQDPMIIPKVSKQLLEMLENGEIDPVIDLSFRLAELPAALSSLQGRQSIGKIVLRAQHAGIAA